MMTLIIIPTGINRKPELIESFAGASGDIVLLEEGKLDFNIKVHTYWKFFMYDGEFLSKDLQIALPEFFKFGKDFDIFSVYKLTPNGTFISPRLFKGEIEMKKDSVYPEKDIQNFKWNTILDGFILGV